MPGKSKQGGGLEVGSSYKIQLHMGAKHGSPIQGNYGSPNKDYSVNKGSHNHPHAPTKYTGHYNDPRMAQGSGVENEVLHGSGQATVQAPLAQKEPKPKPPVTNQPDLAEEVGETEYEMLKRQNKNKLNKVQTGPIAMKGPASPAKKELKPKTEGTLTTTTVGNKKTYHIGATEVTKEKYDAHRKNIKGTKK